MSGKGIRFHDLGGHPPGHRADAGKAWGGWVKQKIIKAKQRLPRRLRVLQRFASLRPFGPGPAARRLHPLPQALGLFGLFTAFKSP